jgi:hypothetical protein
VARRVPGSYWSGPEGSRKLLEWPRGFQEVTVVAQRVLGSYWSGPEGSRKLRLPDFMTTAQDGVKVVSLTHRSPLPPGNTPGTHSC